MTSNKSETILLNEKFTKTPRSMQKFANFINKVTDSDNKEVIIDLSEYTFIDPCYAVLIPSMLYLSPTEKTIIKYKKGSQGQTFLENCGLLAAGRIFRDFSAVIKRSNVEFARVASAEKDKISLITKKIIAAAPINITSDLESHLESCITEVFNNACEHGGQGHCFCCGFHEKGDFTFSIYDTGIGIPAKVRAFLIQPDFADKECLNWARKRGHSTVNDDTRGNGFSFLEELTSVNRGNMFVASSKAVLTITESNSKTSTLTTPLKGTLFSMTIRTDENGIYGFKNN